jgi:hypothetical protein
MTEDDIRGLLRELHAEPVPPDSLARVRLAVDRRLAAKSRLPWYAALVAAAALVVIALLLRSPVEQPAAPVLTSLPPPAIATIRPEPRKATPPKLATTGKRPKMRPAAAPASEHLVVRIETEDPDVLILLIGD